MNIHIDIHKSYNVHMNIHICSSTDEVSKVRLGCCFHVGKPSASHIFCEEIRPG